ncbi:MULTISPECIES: hypothetical protein [Kitasatospora]|uniref:Peptidase inhibitor family I36 n=2 Tax=Kitasatospora TaxID=2063 RepID=A0ABT1IXU3_9ACTN|nr:hypothetical protein [Kitasatospora paracochleata]MCP2309972.1 hypothetical protein [Kitasatospora paracochleata]
MNARLKLAGVALVAGTAVLAMQSPALAAATGHPIDGTCYESGSWFRSSNVRTLSSGSTSVRVSFSTTPSKGLAFYINNYNTGAGYATIFAPPTGTQTLASGLRAGTQFQNNFRLQTAGHQDNYSFSGSETY